MQLQGQRIPPEGTPVGGMQILAPKQPFTPSPHLSALIAGVRMCTKSDPLQQTTQALARGTARQPAERKGVYMKMALFDRGCPAITRFAYNDPVSHPSGCCSHSMPKKPPPALRGYGRNLCVNLFVRRNDYGQNDLCPDWL